MIDFTSTVGLFVTRIYVEIFIVGFVRVSARSTILRKTEPFSSLEVMLHDVCFYVLCPVFTISLLSEASHVFARFTPDIFIFAKGESLLNT